MTMCGSTEQKRELFFVFLWMSLMRLTCLSRRISFKKVFNLDLKIDKILHSFKSFGRLFQSFAA